jgi:hypothetical protein
MARTKIQNGELPCAEHPKTWGGQGRGSACSVCDDKIEPGQLEFEVEMAEPTCVSPVIFQFHVPCHSAWLAECEQLPMTRVG